MSLNFRYVFNNSSLGTIELEYNPIGYDELNYSFTRGNDSHGVFHEIITDLEFIKDGRAYIKQVLDTQGIKGIIDVIVHKYNNNSYAYEEYYTGRVNMVQASISQDRLVTDIETRGFQQTFINSLDVDYNIESVTTDSGSQSSLVDLNLHSKTIQREYNAQSVAGFTNPNRITIDAEGVAFTELFIGIGLNQINTNELSAFTYPLQMKGTNSFVDDQQFIFDVQEDGAYQFDLNIHPQFTVPVRSTEPAPDPFEFFIIVIRNSVQLSKTSIGTIARTGATKDINVGFTEDYVYDGTVSIDTTLNLEVDDRVFIQGEGIADNSTIISGSREADIQFFSDTVIIIKGLTTFPASTVKAVPIYEAFLSICQQISGQTDVLDSTVFGRTDTPIIQYGQDGAWSLLMLTNGNNLRGITDRPITISFNDLFNSLDAMLNIGYTVNFDGTRQVVKVDFKSDFYGSTETLNLLDAYNIGRGENKLDFFTGVERDVADDRYYTEIEFNYPNLEVEQINGLDEYNTTRKFSTPITEVTNRLVLNSSIRASGFEIERQRRLINQSTTDSKLDDEIFVVHSTRNGNDFDSLKNENYTAINNVIDPDTVYNIDLSPTRCIRRWGNVIQSNLFFIDDPIVFSSGTVNYLMSSTRTGETEVFENGNILKTEFPDAIWKNEIYRVTIPLRNEQIQIIRNGPLGYFTLPVKGDNNNASIIEGYILSIETNSLNSYRDELDFNLLLRN